MNRETLRKALQESIQSLFEQESLRQSGWTIDAENEHLEVEADFNTADPITIWVITGYDEETGKVTKKKFEVIVR